VVLVVGLGLGTVAVALSVVALLTAGSRFTEDTWQLAVTSKCTTPTLH